MCPFLLSFKIVITRYFILVFTQLLFVVCVFMPPEIEDRGAYCFICCFTVYQVSTYDKLDVVASDCEL